MIKLLGKVFGGISKAYAAKQEMKTEIALAEHNLKVNKIKREADYQAKALDSDTQADLAAIEVRKSTWLDELYGVVFISPLIMFWVAPDRAKAWVSSVKELPEWYQLAIGGILIATFGLTRFARTLIEIYFNRKKPASVPAYDPTPIIALGRDLGVSETRILDAVAQKLTLEQCRALWKKDAANHIVVPNDMVTE